MMPPKHLHVILMRSRTVHNNILFPYIVSQELIWSHYGIEIVYDLLGIKLKL